MEMRPLGTTGLSVSVIGFGCGAVGGLMVRGAPGDQERAVARAVELGINYFDTAPSYGDGVSETNLGRVLNSLRPNVVVGTKFNVPAGSTAGIEAAVAASLEASLRRLGREQVDLFQLHNPLAESGAGAIPAQTVIDHVLPALERLRTQGKFRFAGFTAIGDTASLHRVLRAGGMATAQVPFNLLNPSAGREVPPGFPGQDYAGTLTVAQAAGMGAIGIRALAGGALSGSEARHPLGVPDVDPIGSGVDYRADVRRAALFKPIADEAGEASTAELAIRFVISHAAISTAMVGLSTIDQLETAAGAAARGALSLAIMERIQSAQDGMPTSATRATL